MVIFYAISMLLIGFHLWHGVWSSLQSLGLGNSRYTPQMVRAGQALAAVITAGFLLIPLWIAFAGVRQ